MDEFLTELELYIVNSIYRETRATQEWRNPPTMDTLRAALAKLIAEVQLGKVIN